MPITTASVYVAAFDGAAAGLAAGGKFLSDPNAGDYAYYTAMAKAFATQVDTAWTASGTPSPSCAEIDALTSAAFGIWCAGLGPIGTAAVSATGTIIPGADPTVPANYAGYATAVVAFAQQCNAQLVLDSIDPNAACNVGGGGGISQLTNDVLAGPGAGSQPATVVAATGATSAASIGGGNLVPIKATDTVLNSAGDDPVQSFVAETTTTNNTPTQIGATITRSETNGLLDFSLSFAGFGQAGDGSFFRCDIVFTSVTVGGVPTLSPATPTPINVRSAGSGSTCSASVSISGTDITIHVTGSNAAVFGWSCIGQIQVRP
jgi:hypothetical protein